MTRATKNLKWIAALSGALLLSACGNSAADHALGERNFARLMNKPIDQAIEILGPADRI